MCFQTNIHLFSRHCSRGGRGCFHVQPDITRFTRKSPNRAKLHVCNDVYIIFVFLVILGYYLICFLFVFFVVALLVPWYFWNRGAISGWIGLGWDGYLYIIMLENCNNYHIISEGANKKILIREGVKEINYFFQDLVQNSRPM